MLDQLLKPFNSTIPLSQVVLAIVDSILDVLKKFIELVHDRLSKVESKVTVLLFKEGFEHFRVSQVWRRGLR